MFLSVPFPMEFRCLFSPIPIFKIFLFIYLFIFFFLGGGGGGERERLGFPFSQHTHMLHGDILLQFNGNSMCNSQFFYFPKMTIVHYNKFPNLGVCQANFPILKGPRALPEIAKKKSTRIVFLRKNRCLPPFDVKSRSH